jgi:hypothetical protein
MSVEKILGYGYQWVCAHCQCGETLGWNCRCQCLQSRLSNPNLAMVCLVFWTAPRVGHQAKRQAQAVSSSLAEPELRFSGGRRWAGDNVAAMA